MANPNLHTRGVPNISIGNMTELKKQKDLEHKYGRRNPLDIKSSVKVSPSHSEYSSSFHVRSKSVIGSQSAKNNGKGLKLADQMITFGDNMNAHPTLKGQNIESIQFETLRKQDELAL